MGPDKGPPATPASVTGGGPLEEVVRRADEFVTDFEKTTTTTENHHGPCCQQQKNMASPNDFQVGPLKLLPTTEIAVRNFREKNTGATFEEDSCQKRDLNETHRRRCNHGEDVFCREQKQQVSRGNDQIEKKGEQGGDQQGTQGEEGKVNKERRAKKMIRFCWNNPNQDPLKRILVWYPA